jgi:hypothetical protein
LPVVVKYTTTCLPAATLGDDFIAVTTTVVTPPVVRLVYFAPQRLDSVVPEGNMKLKDQGSTRVPMAVLVGFEMVK